MKYFFATVAFVLLVIQFTMILGCLESLASDARSTFVGSLLAIAINLVGVFFNVKTLRSSLSTERREL